MSGLKIVHGEKQCLNAIRNNMLKAGCSEEHIKLAQDNYLELSKTQNVEIAINY